MWQRVFCRNINPVSISSVCDHLQSHSILIRPDVRGDDLGWTEAQFFFVSHPRASPIGLSRFLTKEDDLRDDLNAFAAELESFSEIQPRALECMERVIQTQQLITIRKPIDFPNETELDQCCELICRFLAGQGDGIYQIDGQGWMTEAGEEIVHEF